MAGYEVTMNGQKIITGITVSVQVHRTWRARIGMFFMRIGCRVAGFALVDEFPMSLIEPKDLQITKRNATS